MATEMAMEMAKGMVMVTAKATPCLLTRRLRSKAERCRLPPTGR